MKDMTIQEQLQQKFEELERPIFAEDIGLKDILKQKSKDEELYTEDTGYIIKEYTDRNGYHTSYCLFYYPYEEKKEFIYKLLLHQLKNNESINAENFFDILNNSFIDCYNLRSLAPDYFKGGNTFINIFIDRYYFSRNSAYNNLLLFVRNECSDIVQLNSKDNSLYITNKSNRKTQLTKNIMQELFLSSKTISISNLSFELNLRDLPVEIPKPITKKELREIASENDFIVFNKEEDTVRILSDEELIDKIKKHFAANTINFEIFQNEINKPGILALIFTGNTIPLDEMKEYINVRPILYLSNLSGTKTKEDIFLLNKEITKDENNDIKYLKSLFNTEDEYKKWLENNTAISFFEADEIIVKHIYSKLVAELSPISNLTHNPGNLLQYTLKTKLESRFSQEFLKVGEKKEGYNEE